MNKYTYKLKEPHEDPKQATIEKGNITATFTLTQMEADQAFLEKKLKEFYAQKELEEAKIQNIEDHHEFVKDLTEQQCFTVHMYQEAKAIAHVLDKKIPEFEEALAESRAEQKLIVDKLDLKTKEEAVDDAVSKIVDL